MGSAVGVLGQQGWRQEGLASFWDTLSAWRPGSEDASQGAGLPCWVGP